MNKKAGSKSYRRVVEKSAGAVVVDRDGKCVLLIHATSGRGGWGFPKGHIHKGEDSLICALRELEEETGISKTQVGYLGELGEVKQVIRYPKSREVAMRTTVLYFFRAVGELQLDKAHDSAHDRVSWFTWRSAKNLKLRYTHVRKIINKVRKRLHG